MPTDQDIASITAAYQSGKSPVEAAGAIIRANPQRFQKETFKPNLQTIQNADGTQSSGYFNEQGKLVIADNSAPVDQK